MTVNSNSVSGQLLNAAPGLFFAVGGIVILIAVVWQGVNLEVNNTDPDDKKLGRKRQSPKYLGGGGGGGGSSLKAGGSG